MRRTERGHGDAALPSTRRRGTHDGRGPPDGSSASRSMTRRAPGATSACPRPTMRGSPSRRALHAGALRASAPAPVVDGRRRGRSGTLSCQRFGSRPPPRADGELAPLPPAAASTAIERVGERPARRRCTVRSCGSQPAVRAGVELREPSVRRLRPRAAATRRGRAALTRSRRRPRSLACAEHPGDGPGAVARGSRARRAQASPRRPASPGSTRPPRGQVAVGRSGPRRGSPVATVLPAPRVDEEQPCAWVPGTPASCTSRVARRRPRAAPRSSPPARLPGTRTTESLGRDAPARRRVRRGSRGRAATFRVLRDVHGEARSPGRRSRASARAPPRAGSSPRIPRSRGARRSARRGRRSAISRADACATPPRAMPRSRSGARVRAPGASAVVRDPQAPPAPDSQTMIAFCTCRRFSAWSNTTELRAVDHARR